jgi:hypothetical protein
MHRRALAGLTAVLGLFVLAPAAQAEGLTASCEGQVLERPFLPWADPAQYVLAPDGGFGSGADGWQGGDVIDERSPLSGDRALRIDSDSSATSPAMCVTLAHPTLRFLARNAGSPTGVLGVEVLFEDLAGREQSLPIGVVAGGDSWVPTVPMPIVANLLALLPGGQTPVAFRFTARGGDWRIDDVYVDPYCKR